MNGLAAQPLGGEGWGEGTYGCRDNFRTPNKNQRRDEQEIGGNQGREPAIVGGKQKSGPEKKAESQDNLPSEEHPIPNQRRSQRKQGETGTHGKGEEKASPERCSDCLEARHDLLVGNGEKSGIPHTRPPVG